MDAYIIINEGGGAGAGDGSVEVGVGVMTLQTKLQAYSKLTPHITPHTGF